MMERGAREIRKMQEVLGKGVDCHGNCGTCRRTVCRKVLNPTSDALGYSSWETWMIANSLRRICVITNSDLKAIVPVRDSVRLGCFYSCYNPGTVHRESNICIKPRSCEDCPVGTEDVRQVLGKRGFIREITCCEKCPSLNRRFQKKSEAEKMGFQYAGDYTNISGTPYPYDNRAEMNFHEHEVEEIQGIVRLGLLTCSERAAQAFTDMHPHHGYHFKQIKVGSFEEGVEILPKRRRHNDTVLLIPDLHPLQKRLEKDSSFEELKTQRFKLPNPVLAVAHPTGEWNIFRQRVLFTVPALLPLVKKAYGGKVPFREVVPMGSTTDSVFYSVKIFGGGYCVANEMQFEPFLLKPVRELPRKTVTWRLYRRK